MRVIALLVVIAALPSCAGPTTVLQHLETKQVVTCEASAASVLLGGPIGAFMSHNSCVEQHEALGFMAPERDLSHDIPFLAIPNPPA